MASFREGTKEGRKEGRKEGNIPVSIIYEVRFKEQNVLDAP